MKTNGTKPNLLWFAIDELDYLLKTNTRENINKMFEDAKPKFGGFANIKIYYGTT